MVSCGTLFIIAPIKVDIHCETKVASKDNPRSSPSVDQ